MFPTITGYWRCLKCGKEVPVYGGDNKDEQMAVLIPSQICQACQEPMVYEPMVHRGPEPGPEKLY